MKTFEICTVYLFLQLKYRKYSEVEATLSANYSLRKDGKKSSLVDFTTSFTVPTVFILPLSKLEPTSAITVDCKFFY